MQSEISSMFSRLSILEARIQQERSRMQPDQVRLGLLERMKTAIANEIAWLERNPKTDFGSGRRAA